MTWAQRDLHPTFLFVGASILGGGMRTVICDNHIFRSVGKLWNCNSALTPSSQLSKGIALGTNDAIPMPRA